MIFRCFMCGAELESVYCNAPKLFCSKACANRATRTKMSKQARHEELERRRRIIYGQEEPSPVEKIFQTTDGKGIIVPCIICGSPMEQRTATPKLLCSPQCRNVQRREHRVPRNVCEEEGRKRKDAFFAAMTPERKKQLEYERRKRGEFQARLAAQLDGVEEPQPKRYCHNFPKCKNRTWDFYCPECRRKNRMGGGYVAEEELEDTESIWDEFTIPQEGI